MSLVLATITAGAVNGSGFVTVGCALSNGTTIVLYRGEYLIGSGVLASGSVIIAVPPLATGDVIQASVTERGNQAGYPVSVLDTADRRTGWKTPQTVQYTDTAGAVQTVTAAQYLTLFGELPAAVYDASTLINVVAPDYSDPDSTSTVTPTTPVILFDLRIEQQAGLTTVTVQNVLNQSGAPLVRWASAESFGNPMARTYTAAATITIDVKGEGDATYVSRTVSITVFAPSTVVVTSSDIKAFSYRLMFSPDFVRVNANSVKALQCRLEGFDMTWQDCIFYGYGPDYQEGSFYPVPPGTYTIWVRVAGDTDSTHWKSLVISNNT